MLNAIAFILTAQGQSGSPFQPPRASLHYALDRTCDLLNVTVDLDIDYPNRTLVGHVTNTLTPLRNGIKEVTLHAGTGLEITQIKVNGKETTFTRQDTLLKIATPGAVKGKTIKIDINYKSINSKARPFGGEGGFHWIEPTKTNANHIGFWTQGETEFNSKWVPTWDYPNDLATSETRTTVQADWDVVGNGTLISNRKSADGKKRTFVWRMTQPHATYLLSVVGGPFDIKRDKWEGVDLMYVVPKGEGQYIDDSFGDTKDMLSFFSSTLGVKYAWPKYAQNAMYDFGGGMENVSTTTLGEGSITEAREGFRGMASLNSHELGHQWFGDLVTCKDWGDTWLNESFATYMETIYMEHSRGANVYAQEVEGNIRGYLAEARRYKRPLSTKMYPNGDAMFDSHTYPKGGVILHTLRRQLGDENFYAGLNLYLKTWRHTPVESAQLRRAFTEATGINVEPFWAQWIEKPGHPVLDTTWSYDAEKKALTLNVKQTQDTSDGTPIYDIPTKVAAILSNGTMVIMPVHLNAKDQSFTLPLLAAPAAVLLDPDHDFLREIPELHWADSELPTIVQFAPNAVDRAEALRRLVAAKPTGDLLKLIVSTVEKDNSPFPAFTTTGLGSLANPDLHGFWISQLNHPNFGRRAEAVTALGKLPADAATTATLRALITPQAPIQVVVNAINVLAKWDLKSNTDVITKAKEIKDRRGRIARAAENALTP